MRKANAFKKILLLGMVGTSFLSTTPVMAKTMINWQAKGVHEEIPSMSDGRPKFMLEYIDLLNNALTYDYADDGTMEFKPWLIGIDWFDKEEDVQDTSLMESISDFWKVGKAVLGASMDDAEATEIGEGITRYNFPVLNYHLETDDPTGKWGYYLRFMGGDNNLYWNEQVDYTECLLQYRDLRWSENGEMLSRAGCRGSYDENGKVTYSLEYATGEEGSGTGEMSGEEEPDAGTESGTGNVPTTESNVTGKNSDIGEDRSNNSVGLVEGQNEVVQRMGARLANYAGNEVEILGRTRVNSVGDELVGIAEEKDEPKNGEEENDTLGKEMSSTNGDVIEVPELNEGGQNGKIQWWMIATMGGLTLGILIWWIIPIFKRRKDEEEEQ